MSAPILTDPSSVLADRSMRRTFSCAAPVRAQSPAAQSPVAQSPAAQSPAAQSPAAQSPVVSVLLLLVVILGSAGVMLA